MDERCRNAHAKLLAGECPWCGRYIYAGTLARETTVPPSHQPPADAKSLQQLVEEQGRLSFQFAVRIIELIAIKLRTYQTTNGARGGLSPRSVFVFDDDVILSDAAFTLHGNVATSSTLVTVCDSYGASDSIVDYLAPEWALNSHGLDGRADIYSLGCVLYFLLTGHPPFEEGTVAEKLLKHQVEAPLSILEYRPDAPRSIVRLSTKMMAKSAHERYQSPEELLAAIDQLSADG